MKSDKVVLTNCPQMSEMITINKIYTAATSYDVKLPKGAIVEDIKIAVKVGFVDGSNAVKLEAGTTADPDYYFDDAASQDMETAASWTSNIDADKVMSPVASDQIVRFTQTAASAENAAGTVYAYVIYRFAPQLTTPTRLV